MESIQPDATSGRLIIIKVLFNLLVPILFVQSAHAQSTDKFASVKGISKMTCQVAYLTNDGNTYPAQNNHRCSLSLRLLKPNGEQYVKTLSCLVLKRKSQCAVSALDLAIPAEDKIVGAFADKIITETDVNLGCVYQPGVAPLEGMEILSNDSPTIIYYDFFDTTNPTFFVGHLHYCTRRPAVSFP